MCSNFSKIWCSLMQLIKFNNCKKKKKKDQPPFEHQTFQLDTETSWGTRYYQTHLCTFFGRFATGEADWERLTFSKAMMYSQTCKHSRSLSCGSTNPGQAEAFWNRASYTHKKTTSDYFQNICSVIHIIGLKFHSKITLQLLAFSESTSYIRIPHRTHLCSSVILILPDVHF